MNNRRFLGLDQQHSRSHMNPLCFCAKYVSFTQRAGVLLMLDPCYNMCKSPYHLVMFRAT